MARPRKRKATPTKPSEAAIYERARRLANVAMLTIAMQIRRIEAREPEDGLWLRRLADYEFLVAALWRLRLAATLAGSVPELEPRITVAISKFNDDLPGLRAMRNVTQHIDEYARDNGHNKSISRKSLEVAVVGPAGLDWMGFNLEPAHTMRASTALLVAINSGKNVFARSMPKVCNPERNGRSRSLS